MALGFLGGLGLALPALQQGYERAEDRKNAADERKLRQEAFKQDREFQQSQRQRTLDEQKRDDALRAGLSGVPTTQEISLPAAGTMYGKQAPDALRDDDGNLMPGAVETAPATTVKRQRPADAVLADYAEMARKAGKNDLAMDFESKASLAAHKRGGQNFAQWAASTPDDADPIAAARQAAAIFNDDRFPGKVTNVTPGADGKGVTVSMFNSSTGQTLDRNFANVADLKRSLEGYYSPETYNAYMKSLRDAQIKAEETRATERAKGQVIPAGGAFVPGAGDPRKPVVNNNNLVWTGRNNPDGSPEMVRPGAAGSGSGSGAGSGGKPEDPLKGVDNATEFLIKESTAKGALDPDVVGSIRTMSRQLKSSAIAENRNLDDSVAAKLAMDAATGKVKPSNAFNPRTGTIDSVVEYQGSNFALESFGTPQQNRLKPEQVAPVLAGFLSKMPADVRKEMIPAAYNQQARNSLQDGLRAEITQPEWAASFQRANGRAPTEADINAAVASRTKLLDAQLNLISLYGTSGKENGDPVDPGTRKLITETLKQAGYTIRGGKAEPSTNKPEAAAAAPAAQRLQQPGGLGPRPTLAQRQQAIQAAKERMATEEADAARTAMTDAQRLLQAGDVPALARFQASSAFGRLDRATKTAIYNKVNGLQ